MDKRIPENGTVESTNSLPSQIEKSAKRSYKQIYRKDWENNPIFRGWLSPVPCDKHKAECTACNKELLAHRLTLLKHASSAKHLKRVAIVCNSTANSANKIQPSDSVIEDIRTTEQSKIEQFEINGTSSNNDENTVDILPHLVNLSNVNTPQFTDTKIKIDHATLNNIDKEFAEEMEAQLSQLTAEEVVTSTITLQATVSNMPSTNTSVATSPVPENIADIIIHTDSFVGMSDTSEAINYKQGYVTKNKTPQTILCAATFLDNKVNEPGSVNGLNKISTYPLQISTRVTDYSRGISAVNLSITLYMLTGGKWVSVGESVTDDVGRCNMFHKNDSFFSVGLYKLHYDVATYYDQQNLKSYFPFIEIIFQMRSLHEMHHIPLMISPNSYTAYRSMDY